MNSDYQDRLLEDTSLVEQAITFLEEENIVRLIADEFAPSIVIQHRNFTTNRDLLFKQSDSVFSKYLLAGDGRTAWLRSALLNINTKLLVAASEGKVEKISQDQNLTDADSWEPIPLDRDDDLQKEAVDALDRIIEELRGDNGYATTNPEEKAFVQDNLSALAKRLKEDSQISWMYLKEFAFRPLGILIKRFGAAAIGMAASTTKDALTSWLKSKEISFLDDVFK